MPKHGSRTIWSLIAGTAAVLFAAALPFTASGQGKNEVVVAVAPSADMGLPIVAVKKGFLEKQGLRVQMKVFDSSPKAVEALVAGQADITENTEPPHLAARARGGKVVWVMTGYVLGETNGSIVNSSVIKKPEDFAGKSIGVQRGSGAHFHTHWFLKRNNIPTDEVTLKFMAAPDQLAALARNDIQGYFSWEPFLTRAVQTVPNAKLFSRLVDDGLEFNGNVLMREALARNDQETAIKIVKGLIEAADWMNANLREAARVANEVLRAPSEEEVYQQFRKLKWPGNFKKQIIDQAVEIADWGIGIGLFPAKDGRALVEELVYPEIIRAAAPDRTDM